MSDINLQITIKEENSHLFKRCIRKLLESTFLLQDKDEKLYQFIARESNRQDISQYLRTIGFDVLVDEKTGLAMLTASEEDADLVGLKRANVVTFTPLQYHLLLVLYAALDCFGKPGLQRGKFCDQRRSHRQDQILRRSGGESGTKRRFPPV